MTDATVAAVYDFSNKWASIQNKKEFIHDLYNVIKIAVEEAMKYVGEGEEETRG
jgi:hypothetical protein